MGGSGESPVRETRPDAYNSQIGSQAIMAGRPDYSESVGMATMNVRRRTPSDSHQDATIMHLKESFWSKRLVSELAT
jgi:hypothetical protein